ncbi:MAG TPA: glycosyltransferase family 39 protein [Candidatus Binataceae bacterium]|nr:glycosyltransferase family 39 protein [Candidatus Binataceae bacterium]
MSTNESEWQLGTDSGLPVMPPVEPEPQRDRSLERLERPLHTLTAEHCGWLLLIAYAAFSRFAWLSARPLDAGEATRALAMLSGYSGAVNLAPQPGWVNLITAALSALGASAWSMRFVPAFCGLMLIAVAFGLRRYIGRAGGLALALLLTLSPGFAYYARADAPEMPTALMALLTLYAFCILAEHPATARATWLGIVIGLLSAAAPEGRVIEVSFILALALIGLYCLAARQHSLLNIKVWFKRHGGLLLIVVITTLLAWFASAFFASVPAEFASSDSAIQQAGGSLGLIAAVHSYLPALALDEFLIVLTAIVGIAAVLSARLRSILAAWVALWTLFSIILALMLPTDIANLTLMLLPMAVLGALGIEWLHHTNAWPVVRVVVGVLAVLTLYVQILTNFIYYAPDASEAAWNRHANLYWSGLTTTIQTPLYCRRAMAGITPADATSYFHLEAPAVRWYLRGLRPVKNPAIAAVDVGPPLAGRGPEGGSGGSAGLRRFDFDYAVTWPLTWSSLTPTSALRYIFTDEAWVRPLAAPITITSRPSNPPALTDLDE